MKTKNIFYVAGLLLTAAFASCTDEQDELGLQEGRIEVSVEKASVSRTILEDDSKTVTWESTDQIYLFDTDGKSNGTLNLKRGAGETTATFSGKVTGQLAKIDKALYPVPTVKDNKYTYSFPAEREWTADSDAPMIGDVVDKKVSFRNLAAMVRIDLQGYTYDENSELVLTMKGQAISGTATVNLTDETISIADGGNSLTVTGIGKDVRFIDLPVPAGTYEGYLVTLNGVKLAENGEERVLTKDNVAILGQTKSELTPNENGVYEIRTAADMFWLAEQVNNAVNYFENKTVMLINDIDMSLKDWTPIGGSFDGIARNFEGTFDGNGKKISGLNVKNVTYAALFGRTSGNCEIKNLTIADSYFEDGGNAACLVSFVLGNLKLESVSATGSTVLANGVEYPNRLIGSKGENAEIIDGDSQFITTIEELQAALDEENVSKIKVVLGCDLEGDVTVTQKANVNVTIDGNNRKFAGTITVDGKSARYETAALTIKNVKFEAEALTAGVDAYIRLGYDDNARYTNNVTVKGCSFSGTGNEFVAIKSYTGGDKNLTIDGCTVNEGMHSLAQLKGIDENLVVTDCHVYSKNGLNINNGNNLTMSECNFDVQGYAVRFGSDNAVYDRNFEIEYSDLKSACAESEDAVIEFRAGAVNATLSMTGTTLTGNTLFKGNTAETTIIIDGVTQKSASTQDDLETAIASGEKVNVTLSAGTYTIPASAAEGKNLTISGTQDTKISVISGLSYAKGATITFDGITIQSKPEGEGYNNGFADLKYACFNNCVIDGTLGLDFSCEFNECEFNIAGSYYNVWTWGAGTATFNNCTFNCDGKALLVYANVLDNDTYHQTVNITDCTFNDNGDNTVTGKAAIEITNTYKDPVVRTYDVIINNTEVNGFTQTVPGAGDFNAAYGSVEGSNIGTNVWGNKMKLPNTQINVIIDGVDVY